MPYSHDFLFIEFLNKKNMLARLRYQIKQKRFHFPRVQITEKRQYFGFKGRQSKRACIVVDSHISESDLFQELRNYISEKHGVEKEAIAFRWENGNLKFVDKVPQTGFKIGLSHGKKRSLPRFVEKEAQNLPRMVLYFYPHSPSTFSCQKSTILKNWSRQNAPNKPQSKPKNP